MEADLDDEDEVAAAPGAAEEGGHRAHARRSGAHPATRSSIRGKVFEFLPDPAAQPDRAGTDDDERADA